MVVWSTQERPFPYKVRLFVLCFCLGAQSWCRSSSFFCSAAIFAGGNCVDPPPPLDISTFKRSSVVSYRRHA